MRQNPIGSSSNYNHLVTVRPDRKTNEFFRGWGPKLLVAAFIVASCRGAFAATLADDGPVAPVCGTSDRDVVALDIPLPERPEIAREQDQTGTVLIRFDLSAKGDVQATRVVRSSGYPLLDAAALRAAREARFAPAVEECRPTPASFGYEYDFDE